MTKYLAALQTGLEDIDWFFHIFFSGGNPLENLSLGIHSTGIGEFDQEELCMFVFWSEWIGLEG